MRLSSLLAGQVASRVRTKGEGYAAAGRVGEVQRHNGILSAVVRGEDDYEVYIEADGGTLRASCTCPYFLDHIDICKHVWATILAAEESGLPLIEPGRAPSRGQIRLVAVDIDADDIDDDPLDDKPWPPPVGEPPRTAARAPMRQPPPPAAWRVALDTVARSMPAYASPAQPVGQGQLVYVVDVAASVGSRGLVIELMTRDRKKSGEWGKPRAARVSRSDIDFLPAGTDRSVLERLVGASADSYGYGSFAAFSRFELTGALVADVVPALARDGQLLARVFDQDLQTVLAAQAKADPWARQRRLAPKLPQPSLLALAFDDGPPWSFAPSLDRDAAADAYRIDGALVRGEERMTIATPLVVLDAGFVLTPTHVARLDHGGMFAWLSALRANGAIAVPTRERITLLDALLINPLHAAALPEELNIVPEAPPPRPLLRVMKGQWADRFEAEVAVAYGDVAISPLVPTPIVRTEDASRIVRRDLKTEQTYAEMVRRAGFKPEWSPRAHAPVPQIAAGRLPAAIRTLLDEGWHVTADGVTYRQPGAVRATITSGIDWFDLDADVEYAGQHVPLPAILAAVARGDRFVTLGDGSHGLLPEEWLRRHGVIARLGSKEGAHLRFTRSQVGLLDALLAAQPEITCDETFARARDHVASFEGITPADAPAAFTGTLRGYQKDALGWLLFLRRFGFGGCLADDMGLGKTIMVLALLAHARAERGEPSHAPALVVAPRSLVFNWMQEAARFTPHLRVLDYTGTGRTDVRDRLAEYDIVLTTYGTLRRDAAHLATVPFDSVILDEAQAIKNASSASAKAVRLLRGQHRLALSGTPIENHLGELWSLFEFLNPGVLGSSAAFAGASSARTLDDETVALLSRGLRPFILRRTKAQVAPELPAKTEQTVYCELERPQRQLYDLLRDHYRRTLLARTAPKDLGRSKLRILEALLRLRQAACHPALIDETRAHEGSAKFDVLVPQILQAVEEGHKALVFSQFTSLLALLMKELDRKRITYEYLDGQTRDRQAPVARFQSDPECRLFLISLKAGGVGLNLTAAEYVFLLDPWWNPAVEAQAIDRTHRIGQTRHVFAYRLIAKDTVEERVLELQQQKRALADAVLNADESILRTLARDDLELLLS